MRSNSKFWLWYTSTLLRVPPMAMKSPSGENLMTDGRGDSGGTDGFEYRHHQIKKFAESPGGYISYICKTSICTKNSLEGRFTWIDQCSFCSPVRFHLASDLQIGRRREFLAIVPHGRCRCPLVYTLHFGADMPLTKSTWSWPDYSYAINCLAIERVCWRRWFVKDDFMAR